MDHDSQPRSTPAVTRAFAILQLLRTEGPLGLSDISLRLQLPKSTVHELVNTLVRLKALEQATNRGNRYSLGLLLHELGSAYLSEVSLARDGQQVAEAVAKQSGETVHLASLDGVDAVYIAKVDSVHAVRMVSAVGRRLPAHCTGVGKALLSGLADEELVERFGGEDTNLAAMTPKSITSLSVLLRQLQEIRGTGVAFDDCESNPDVRCVAAPVFDDRGQVVAAMSISVPTLRATRKLPDHLVGLVRDGASELSRKLGWQPVSQALGAAR